MNFHYCYYSDPDLMSSLPSKDSVLRTMRNYKEQTQVPVPFDNFKKDLTLAEIGQLVDGTEIPFDVNGKKFTLKITQLPETARSKPSIFFYIPEYLKHIELETVESFAADGTFDPRLLAKNCMQVVDYMGRVEGKVSGFNYINYI